MEIPSQEAEMPIPLNSTYGGGHAHAHPHHAHAHMMHHHHHHHHDPPPPQPSSLNQINVPPPSGPAPISSTPDHDDVDDEEDEDDDGVHDHGANNNNNNNNSSNSHHLAGAVVPFQKPVRYRECLKNHAASMGGNATDGCGEFMPSGEDGTLEALTCSACSCHRNFHRKETDGGGGGPTTADNSNSRMGRKVYLGHRYLGQDNSGVGYHQISSRAHHYGPGPLPHHPMIMSYNMPSESDEMEGNNNNGGSAARPPSAAAALAQKKRFRTKFSQEQKEKMLSFAEKVGWKIQKQEEGVVQQFCQEVGVKRRVLKVWMHNNKHNLAKKQQQQQQQQQLQLHHHHQPIHNNNNNSDNLNQV